MHMKQAMPIVLILAAVMLGGVAFAARADDSSGADKAGAQTMVTHVCETCHGKQGNSTDPDVPSLAGQGSAYLQRQLAAFKAQRRVGVMSGIAMTLSDFDIRYAATYFSQQILQVDRNRTIDPGALTQGEAIYDDGIAAKGVPACASCHELNGTGLSTEFPRLAGQHSRYIAGQLRAFRSDSRLSNPNAMMRKVSAKLSDDEIDAVAVYIEYLH